MPKPKRNNVPAHSAKLRLFLAQQLSTDDVQQRAMFACPAFFTGRRMFACVYGRTVGLKLPTERVQQLLRMPGFEPFTPYGKRTMREWIAIVRPEDPMVPTAALLNEAQQFVGAQS